MSQGADIIILALVMMTVDVIDKTRLRVSEVGYLTPLPSCPSTAGRSVIMTRLLGKENRTQTEELSEPRP